MFRFIESICFHKGAYQLLPLHQERVHRTFNRFFRGQPPLDLNKVLPKLDLQEKYKVRVVYDAESCEVEFGAYVARPIRSLRLVEAPEVRYDFKFENRSALNECFEKREEADDIIILKRGIVQDSWYANLAFWDGFDWVTPSTCLLEGVKRAHYLASGRLISREILGADMKKFEKVCLINAMLDLGECEIPVSQIRH